MAFTPFQLAVNLQIATKKNLEDEINRVASELDGSIGLSAFGLEVVSTIAERDAFYSNPTNHDRLVYVNNNNSSPTDPANGVYEFVGSSARPATAFYAALAAPVRPLVAEAETARDEAEEARDQAVSARNSSQLAQSLSEAARDESVLAASTAESVSGPTYSSVADGVAATADGDSFAVDNGDGTVTVYLNSGGVGVEQRTLATTAALAAPSGSSLIGFSHSSSYPIGTVGANLSGKVNVKDLPFGAKGDWNGAIGNDDAAAIQAAVNFCILTGKELEFPDGRFYCTAPIEVDVSGNTADPTNGGVTGINMIGAGAGRSQIVSGHNGDAIKFTGGLSAGWHTYFRLSGISCLKSNFNRAVGSVGLNLDQVAYAHIDDYDFYGFEYGIYGTDVLSTEFGPGTIRGNEHGYRFQRGSRSHPNNIAFRGAKVLNNRTTGGTVIRPALFSVIGGSIESNGYTGILADPNSWGLHVDSGGSEGAVGINLQGVYFENNNGRADVWILQTVNRVVHTILGCSFLRFSNTRYVTNDILFNANAGNDSKVAIGGCGFKDLTSYEASTEKAWIGAGNAQILDMGGNTFFDPAGGLVGMARAVFAPIGANHQLPYASMPDPAKFRNAIQYCADGGGGSTRPSLAVSDGSKWNHIVLGQYSGMVAADGDALNSTLPRGWTCVKNQVGVYTVTHDLPIAGGQYSVVVTARGARVGKCVGVSAGTQAFVVYMQNSSNVDADMPFSFEMRMI